jgi:hypothetical protein
MDFHPVPMLLMVTAFSQRDVFVNLTGLHRLKRKPTSIHVIQKLTGVKTQIANVQGVKTARQQMTFEVLDSQRRGRYWRPLPLNPS